ncbi:MAG: DUF3280 domain-containing protein [Paracoccus sp. (in: a-proteobacteria)]|nr:DUF3280 domain-containing protein [Paracoccus sp. (in: a-proteobacteria)]
MTSAAAQQPVPPGKVAFFGLHFIDTSAEGAINGIRDDEVTRLALVQGLIADDLVARGFELVDTTPVQAELALIRNPAHCNGCDSRLAGELGADYAVTGEVQKVSNLILSANLYIRRAGPRETLRHGAVEIRSNTDESWTRGYRYLLRRTIFPES